MRILRMSLVLTLFLAAGACGSGDDTTDRSTSPTTSTRASTTDTSVPAGTEPTATTSVAASTVPSATVPAATTTTLTTAPATTSTRAADLVDVKVYFLRGERLAIAHRQVPAPAVLRGAMVELLAGPTAEELAAGLFTVVPSGTELLDLNLADGLATVDLSSDYESGGGSLSMMARIAQVIFTATQFDNSDRVLFWLDGHPIDYLGGEGLVLDEPQARMDADRSITGSVIIDTPAYGATVSSPFAVTGEGDVFEGDFPLEVWANGQEIGRVAPVFAGAWGMWRDFETTITLDAPPGPIELVAYDGGGCGTDPECPPIIRTVVPLTLSD